MIRFLGLICSLTVLCIGVVGMAHAAEPFEDFLANHCLRCHGPKKEKRLTCASIGSRVNLQGGRGCGSLAGSARKDQCR